VELSVPTSITANVRLGAGVNLDDPTFPILTPQSPFLPHEIPHEIASAQDNPIPVNSIASASTSFAEGASDYEFSHTLSADLNASFGFASANASYDYVKNIRQTSDIIVAIITLSTTAPQLDSSLVKWSSAPSSESDKIKTEADRLRQFIEDYGSHYILAIKYGYRVAVYGRLDTKTQSEVMSFHAAFKAAFSGGGAGGGGLSESQKETLSSSHVELRAEVAAGRIEPEQSIVLTGFNQIYPFLEQIRQGQIKLYPGPIEVSAKSYWTTLIDYPKTRSLLAETKASRRLHPTECRRGLLSHGHRPIRLSGKKMERCVSCLQAAGLFATVVMERRTLATDL
jgi:hypothetical protein